MAGKDECSDLSQLDQLDENTILQTLESRYSKDLIYTNCGEILIALNPCKPLPIFGKKQHDEYSLQSNTKIPPPHVFHTAARAYQRLRETSSNQIILVSGESGAGKTESTKLMVKHLVTLCPRDSGDLHDRIIKINPLLEAFGNAKTMMNNNSSRFAKFLELNFKDDGQVIGGSVRDYLLEKSRVVMRNEDEGNFHIFYYLFAGAPAKYLSSLGLKGPEHYRIMKSNTRLLRATEDHKRKYEEQMAVLRAIGLQQPDMDIIHSILAAILHLTEIDFHEDASHNQPLRVKDVGPLQSVADLLNVSSEELGHALISQKTKYAGDVVIRNKTVNQAADGRDALAKALYERLFGWLVKKINEDLHPAKQRQQQSSFIGILDIAGFENLTPNSLEQLCINMVNERLQNFTNRTVIVTEMAIFEEQGITNINVQFENNDRLLTLFLEKEAGVLALLDENTRLEQGTDASFVSNLVQKHGEHKHFVKLPGDAPEFKIKHFAGEVKYDARGFIEKNKDTLNEDLDLCMKGSSNEFIVDLFTIKKAASGTISATLGFNIRQSRKAPQGGATKKITEAGRQLQLDLGKSLIKMHGAPLSAIRSRMKMAKDQKTVISYFANSMNQLMGKMKHSEPYFVRCIKPNDTLEKDHFSERKVRNQLLYNGILEIAKIRKLNLPVRKDFTEFVDRYHILRPECRRKLPREGTLTIMKLYLPKQKKDCVKYGKSKVFMTEDVSVMLERFRAKKEMMACKIIGRVVKHGVQEKKKQREEAEKTLNQLKKELSNSESSASDQRSSGSSTVSSDISNKPDDEEEEEEEEEEDDGMRDSNTKFDWLKSSTKNARLRLSDRATNETPTKPTEEPEGTGNDKAFWDIFQIISREAKTEDVHKHRYLQILKIITYAFLALLLLACLVSQKISLMTLVSEQYTDNDDLKTARYILVLIALCIPYGLMFLSNLWKSLFGNVPLPTLKTVVLVIIMEGLHVTGLCLLVFRVLPEIDVVRGILLLSTTCLLPGILKPMCSQDTTKGKTTCTTVCGKMFKFCLDLLACVAQISAIPIVVLNHYYIRGEVFSLDNVKIVELSFALFLSSFSHWENFTDDRLCGKMSSTSSLQIWMLGMKFDLQESRPILFTLSSMVKTGLAIGLAFLLKDENISFNVTTAFDTLSAQSSDIRLNSSIVILTVSSFVAHYCAYTACKLQMQIVSYSIPLVLSTPVAAALVYLDCTYNFLNQVSMETRECDDKLEDEWWHIPIAAAWLLSLYWIGRHIWFPKQKRLEKVENMFTNPLYCGILLEQHLLLNRRRHIRKIFKSHVNGVATFKLSNDNQKPGAAQSENSKKIPPMIYACGTMWHETRQEMVQILKSLFRMDRDQFKRKQALQFHDKVSHEDVEYYEFEPHILFDDAFETAEDDDGTERRVPNSFVRLLMDVMDEAASSVHEKPVIIDPPFKIPSPYGGQLVFMMPGENLMYVHLKDKNKIRHRKRWSQVMYMYYLLGYRIVKECQERIMNALENNEFNSLVSWREFEENVTGQMGKSQIFQFLDDEVLYRAENTFILALDGDVDFTPGAVRLLLDKMHKNPRVGASCGRIHPIGKGPVVWFQKFEYAIAHWLQKATEHVLGCVLCSPGCFSLFRGSALMDDNVMRKYTIIPTEASHHLMYDQGEDRWLCTLLLQQGYRVDYAAASDAFTYAPEGFDEFFNQRRRWMPSTVANILDLLQDGRNTVAINNNISWLYIFYQGCLMVSTVLGPSTVLMMIAGAILTVFGVDLIWSYVISCVPAVLYFFACFYFKSKYQLLLAQALSAVYIFIMMVVFVGCIITAAQESPLHPSVLFLSSLVAMFLIAAFLHPQEFSCIIYGALYFVCMPTGYLILVIYSLCNMHVISWGTREVPKKKTKAELEEEEKLKKEKEEKKKRGFFSRFLPSAQFQDFAKFFGEVQRADKRDDPTFQLLAQMNRNFEELIRQTNAQNSKSVEINIAAEEEVEQDELKPKGILKVRTDPYQQKRARFAEDTKDDKDSITEKKVEKERDEMTNPHWIEEKDMGNGITMTMNPEEANFWTKFIDRYLKPLDSDKAKQKATLEKLIELRNGVCAGMAIINLMWIAINFMFQLRKPAVITFPIPSGKSVGDVSEDNIKIDALGLMFVIFYVVILTIQFIGMVMHRWGTFLHLIAITEIPNPFGQSFEDNDPESGEVQSKKVDRKALAEKAMMFCDKLLTEPVPDYPDSDDEDEQQRKKNELTRAMIENLATTGTKDAIGNNKSGVNIGMSLRNTTFLNSSRGRTSVSSKLGRTLTSDVDFRKSVNNFLLQQDRPAFENDSSLENQQFRRRKPTAGGYQLGETLVNDVLEDIPRRPGTQVPFQKDLLKRMKDRNLESKIRDYPRSRHNDGANGSDLGRTFQPGDHTDIEEEEDENIYDEIPAAGGMGTMSKHFRKNYLRFKEQTKKSRNNSNWRQQAPNSVRGRSNARNHRYDEHRTMPREAFDIRPHETASRDLYDARL